MTSLKNEIEGTWKLLSYIELPVGGSDSCFPMGKSPKGLLLFTPDGYMAVQIAPSEDASFKSGDKLQATDEEYIHRGKTFIAFSGKYQVNNITACVEYQIQTSLYPNWEGTTQVRKLDFEGDVLYQKSLEPILSNGQLVYAYMTWQRVTALSDAGEYEEVLNNTY